ncbi:hypothetical protein E3N88_28690 [Mikania micrantha]|uniref:Uncharacterized protein n=1 Tax=Mikania micrantha TaxID=192012 RepID=A0A5N6N074_9ASTR|nr:hypothetical protein E3N88_28690 [Mikania micrantha]
MQLALAEPEFGDELEQIQKNQPETLAINKEFEVKPASRSRKDEIDGNGCVERQIEHRLLLAASLLQIEVLNLRTIGSKPQSEVAAAQRVGLTKLTKQERRGQTRPNRKLSSTVMKIDEGEIIEDDVSALKGDDGNKDLTGDVTGWDCKAEQRTREESERVRLQERFIINLIFLPKGIKPLNLTNKYLL